MNWTPRFKHISQWGTGGPGTDNAGSNNCAEAASARAILEYDPSTSARMANAEWQLVRQIHDPAAPQGVQDLINRLSILGRGQPNGPWNGFTSAAGIQHILDAFGLAWNVHYTDNVGAAGVIAAVRDSAMALLWVDGTALWPSSYAGDYFGGDFGWDHIICNLPDGNLCNDPLTDVPDRKTDVRYSWDALQGAIGGCWVLPAPEGISSTATLKQKAGLKLQPNHICKAVEDLAAGARVTLLAGTTPHWRNVKAADGKTGWLLSDTLASA